MRHLIGLGLFLAAAPQAAQAQVTWNIEEGLFVPLVAAPREIGSYEGMTLEGEGKISPYLYGSRWGVANGEHSEAIGAGLSWRHEVADQTELRLAVGVGPLVDRDTTRHGSPYVFQLGLSITRQFGEAASCSIGVLHFSNGGPPLNLPFIGGEAPNAGEDFLTLGCQVDALALVRADRRRVRARHVRIVSR